MLNLLNTNMKVLILGATGYSGKAILMEALYQNHEVTVLVRNKSKVTVHHPNLSILEGDALDTRIIANALENQEAVIQCLGVGGKGDGKPNTVVSDATKILVEAMETSRVERLIALSNVGAGNSISFLPGFFTKIVLPYFMKWLKEIIEDKNRMEPIIMDSNLNWTIVRCPAIVDKPAKGSCNPTLDGKGLKLSVTLGDMAGFIIGQLTDSTYSRQAPAISN